MPKSPTGQSLPASHKVTLLSIDSPRSDPFIKTSEEYDDFQSPLGLEKSSRKDSFYGGNWQLKDSDQKESTEESTVEKKENSKLNNFCSAFFCHLFAGSKPKQKEHHEIKKSPVSSIMYP